MKSIKGYKYNLRIPNHRGFTDLIYLISSYIPILMKRPLHTRKAFGVLPLILTARTLAFSIKSVPSSSTTFLEKFGCLTGSALPQVMFLGLPFATRASYVTKFARRFFKFSSCLRFEFSTRVLLKNENHARADPKRFWIFKGFFDIN